MRHRHRKTDRDRGIDGIAAVLEDLEADPGRGRFLARDHAVLGERPHPVEVPRGPVGLEGLTSLKWIVLGEGQLRA